MHVYWAENGSLVALATLDQYFILKYYAEVVAVVEENYEDIENAFQVSCLSELFYIIFIIISLLII